MMPLNYILKKWTGGYNLIELQEKINYLMHMDGIKLLVKNVKELVTDTNNKNIQPGYRNGIWYYLNVPCS